MKKILSASMIVLLSAVLFQQKTFAGNTDTKEVSQPYDLIVETVTFSLDNPGIESVESAVNEITVPAIGVRVHLLNVPIQQHAQYIGQMIANGEQLDLVTAGLTESVPRDLADVPAPELLFEVEPDRVTVRAALLRWDENGELLTSYDDFYEIRIDEEYRDYLVTREDSVVEITAEWDERDGFGGHALYVFRVGGQAE